jgi:hypothetical protein
MSPATAGKASPKRLSVTRAQVVAFRRHASHLDARLPPGPASLEQAASAGLQDSMPRAAVLSLHARVEGIEPGAWDDPALVQVWGPRFSAYVIAERDRALFTLGRLPDAPDKRRELDDLADQLEAFLDGRRMGASEAAKGIGVRHPNALRYAAPTGRVLIRWDGARRPDIWTVPAPDLDPFAARVELARRYLHVFGPATAASFQEWAGIRPPRGQHAFDALSDELRPVRTPIGDAWILAADAAALRAAEGRGATRLLPSGDTFFLLWGRDRELLVSNDQRRAELWTSRVWPGAVLVDGEIVGTWRRAGAVVQIDAWRRLPKAARDAVESEAASFPLPDLKAPVRVSWLSGT